MATNWWKYATRVMKEHTELVADSVRRTGISASNYTRWAGGTLPKPEYAVRFARAYEVNVLEALVAVGLITEEEAKLTHVSISKTDAANMLTDEDLALAILDRTRLNSDSVLTRPIDEETITREEKVTRDVSSLRAVEKDEVSAPEPEAAPASSSRPVYDDAFYARIDDIAAHPENYDLAAMEHEPDPYEGLGEESQLTPGWDENEGC